MQDFKTSRRFFLSKLDTADHEGTSSYEKTTAATPSCLEVVNCTIHHAILGMIIPKLMDKDPVIAWTLVSCETGETWQHQLIIRNSSWMNGQIDEDLQKPECV
ncbi:hypothetical protein BDA99DRAFT_573438 [Phascolomyces articulosus]|uniref:Uncharacterized protein n=1 Tax=Phascolomyces articulosus TaxID=60185 RepID=A0AAD5PCA0_9FUNG|nr:hypothetical protein BDA99DRAFT_573438 [Phascolomyces articulosus]